MMPRLSLGPIQYFWPREQVFAFYRQMAEWPVDLVYLGENVCAKRRQLREADWLELAAFLSAAGKQVVLSSLLLISAGSELATLRRLCSQRDYPVEVNDLAGVQLREGAPFVAGPGINLYNARAMQRLAAAGMVRWVLPVELGERECRALHEARPSGVETEVTVFGRPGLAHSARCFTARAHDLAKDDCGFRCLEDPAGELLRTRNGEPFLNINGIQLQPAAPFSLLAELPALADLGVEWLRLYPEAEGMAEVVAAFDAVLRGEADPQAEAARLDALLPLAPGNGFWHGEPGMARVSC